MAVKLNCQFDGVIWMQVDDGNDDATEMKLRLVLVLVLVVA